MTNLYCSCWCLWTSSWDRSTLECFMSHVQFCPQKKHLIYSKICQKVCNLSKNSWESDRWKWGKREWECRLSISTGQWSRARTTLAFPPSLRHYWTSKPEPIDFYCHSLISSYGWNMQLYVFAHLLSISSWWSKSGHSNRTLTKGWWKLEMHVLPHYIKVSDNTTPIFICRDGTISFFSITMSVLF